MTRLLLALRHLFHRLGPVPVETRLVDGWATIRDREHAIEAIARLSEVDPATDPVDGYRVDARTWADLDMPLVFRSIDRTLTAPGAQRLYQLLMAPVASTDELERRERLISLLGEDVPTRDAVQRRLLRLDHGRAWDLPDLLWGELPESPLPMWLLHLLSWGLPVVALAALWQPVLWLVALGLFAINICIEIWMQRIVATHMGALGFLQRVIGVARELASLRADGLGELQAALRANLVGTRAIAGRAFLLGINDPADLIAYQRAARLRNVIGFFQIRTAIIERRQQLQALYKDVGLLDAAQAVASFRHHGAHCVPSFIDTRELAAREIRHPAVAAAVGNDLTLPAGRGVLVTGSNMSGKSTFVKAIGVNAILAQTIHTVVASSYQAPLLRVMSSVDVLDDLGARKSYYLDEVESVLRMVRAADGGTRCLFVADEMFRGTNPSERVATASAVLDYLARDHVVVAATHDLELCEVTAARFDSWHFREQLTETGITFDYRLRRGRCTSRNAIALLRFAGYPGAIVDAATVAATTRSGELTAADAPV